MCTVGPQNAPIYTYIYIYFYDYIMLLGIFIIYITDS
jgi:hypothetical protein